MKNQRIRFAALTVAVALAVFVTLGANFNVFAQHEGHTGNEQQADPHAGHGQAPAQQQQDHSAHAAPKQAEDHSAHGAPKPAEDHSAHAKPAQSAPAKNSGERKILYWYDPMHPQYKSDKPGAAPDCGMDLVPKYEDEVAAAGAPAGTVMIPPQKQALIGVRTAVVGYGNLARSLRTTATVAQDESRIAHVHVKVMGFVEKTFANYPGEPVRKGQPLFTLYSPDLVATQQEYLIARRGHNELGGSQFREVSNNAHALMQAARERLRLWDISDEQIAKLEKTGEVQRTLTFYSPVTGTVLERKAFPNTSVTPEMELYTIADYSTVWVIADVFEADAALVRVGMPATVTLSYLPGRTFRARVSFIAPTVDPMTRTLKVRLELPNPGGKLRPGMFAEVQFTGGGTRELVIPQEAVMDTGTRQVVYVAGKANHFEPREVKLGARVGDKVAVVSGLAAGETIVTSGNFLIDSESRMNSTAGATQHQH